MIPSIVGSASPPSVFRACACNKNWIHLLTKNTTTRKRNTVEQRANLVLFLLFKTDTFASITNDVLALIVRLVSHARYSLYFLFCLINQWHKSVFMPLLLLVSSQTWRLFTDVFHLHDNLHYTVFLLLYHRPASLPLGYYHSVPLPQINGFSFWGHGILIARCLDKNPTSQLGQHQYHS
jgi:hypothetical protein